MNDTVRYKYDNLHVEFSIQHSVYHSAYDKQIHFCKESSFSVSFFGKIGIRIFDPRSLGSWCIRKEPTNPLWVLKDSSVFFMRHDPSDLGSKIRIRIFPKKRALL